MENNLDEHTKVISFELPCKDFDAIPLDLEERINLGFLEVGVKPKGKTAQLRNKKQLILKYWGDKYKNELGIERIYK